MKKVWIFIIAFLMICLIDFFFIAAIVKLGAVIIGYKFTWKVVLFCWLLSILAYNIFGHKNS